jgi:integrase
MPKLTDNLLLTLTVQKGRKDRLVFDTVAPGLGVRVTAKGTRTFVAQWMDPATKRKVREPLGVWGNLSIARAREAAKVRLGEVAKGINPRAERLRLKAQDERTRAETALSFEVLVDEWAELHLARRRQRYRDEAQRAIKHVFADLLKKPAARITRAEVINILDRLLKNGTPAMAARSLAYARAAFNWAAKREKIPSNPLLGLPIAAGTAERDRVLTDAELEEIWVATDQMTYPWGPFFRMAILTLQRREEVAGMRWSELSPDRRVWALPGRRMKNGKSHSVHLAEPARALLSDLIKVETCDYVFSTTHTTPVSGFAKAKAALDAAIIQAREEAAAQAGNDPAKLVPWVLHDLRRTGASTLARLGFDSIAIDKLLAHQPTKLRGVAAIYQRYDFARERANALDAWAAHVVGSRSIAQVSQPADGANGNDASPSWPEVAIPA